MNRLLMYGVIATSLLMIGCVGNQVTPTQCQNPQDIPVTTFVAPRRLTEDDVANILKKIILKQDERIMIISDYSPTRAFVYTAEKGGNESGRRVDFVKKDDRWVKSGTRIWNSDD